MGRNRHGSLDQGNPPQSPAVAAGLRAACCSSLEKLKPEIAHAAFRAFGARHRAAGRAAQPRDRVRGRQDRRYRRRPAQCHARQPDRTGHRADRIACRSIHAGEGVRSPARSSPTRCSCWACRFCSAASSTTRRSSAGPPPGSRRPCFFWRRSRCWFRRRSPSPIPRRYRRSPRT